MKNSKNRQNVEERRGGKRKFSAAKDAESVKDAGFLKNKYFDPGSLSRPDYSSQVHGPGPGPIPGPSLQGSEKGKNGIKQCKGVVIFMKTLKNGQNVEEKRGRKIKMALANDGESVKDDGGFSDAINHMNHKFTEGEGMRWVNVDLVVRRWEVGVGNPCVCSMCGKTARALGRFEMGNRSGELPWLRVCFCDGCLARLVLSFRFDDGIIPFEDEVF